MRITVGFCLTTALAISASMLSAGSAQAQRGRQQEFLRATILNATANLSNGQLTVEGTDFPRDSMVMLDGQSLTIVSGSATSIVATLPNAILSAPGSYALILESPRRQVLASFVVTIGAVGPAGPVGMEGPRGPRGRRGPAGTEGPAGPQGPAGNSLPPTAYGATFSGGVDVGSGKTATGIANLVLAPGSYILQAVVSGTLGTSDTLDCSIYDDANVSGTGAPLTTGQVDLQSASNLPLQGLIAIPNTDTTDTVRLYCGSQNSTEGGITASIVAFPITASSFQPFSNTIGGNSGVPAGGWNLQQNNQD